MTGRRTSRATACTAQKSPSEDTGNPASMTSTPSRSSWCAIRSFSAGIMLQPGDCSPSRKVVSKIVTCSRCDKSCLLARQGRDSMCKNRKGHHPTADNGPLSSSKMCWLHHPLNPRGASTRPRMATLRASSRSRSSRPIRFALGADGFMAATASQRKRTCTLGDWKGRVNDEGHFSDANYCLQSSGFSIGGTRCVLQRRDLRCHFRLNVLFRDLADQRADVAKNLIILIFLRVAEGLKHTTALQ